MVYAVSAGEAESVSGSLSESVSRGGVMGFGHEKLDVYCVAMLTKFGQRGCAIHEDPMQHTAGIDPDSDTDPDAAGNRKREERQPLASGDG